MSKMPKLWRTFARTIPESDVVESYKNEIQDQFGDYNPHLETMLQQQLAEMYEITKSTRTRAHKNLIYRAWYLRMNSLSHQLPKWRKIQNIKRRIMAELET